jgi:small subunit ribosomal protein S7
VREDNVEKKRKKDQSAPSEEPVDPTKISVKKICANIDNILRDDYVINKKNLYSVIVWNKRKLAERDLNRSKFFYCRFAKDPIYDSFLLNKVINCFMRHGKKEKIRKIFYKIFLSDKSTYGIEALYGVIHALSPRYLNVVVRRGAEIYRAPILATPLKSTLKAIRFFKQAVLSRRYDKTLREKIENELYDFYFTFGYYNEYHMDYVSLSDNSLHLKHYRSKRIY